MEYIISDYEIEDILRIKKLITVFEQRFSGGYFFRGESHNFYELVCVLDGSVQVTAGKNIFTLSAGQMTLHAPLEFHAISEHRGSCPTVIIFSFIADAFPEISSNIYGLSEAMVAELRDIYGSAQDIFSVSPIVGFPEHDIANASVVMHGGIIGGVRKGQGAAASRLAKRLELLLCHALEAPTDIHSEVKNTSKENYLKIIRVMEDNICGGLSADELAHMCEMSVPLMEKTVHKYLHCGAMSYYNVLRMNRAYQLLCGGESVKSVANTLGFSTQHYFSLAFKKHFGVPPSTLKNMN